MTAARAPHAKPAAEALRTAPSPTGSGAPVRIRTTVAGGAAQVLLSGRLQPPHARTGSGNQSLLVGVDSPGAHDQSLAARRGLLAAAGLTLERAVFAEQVHGGQVAVVGVGDGGRGAHDAAEAVAAVDGLVTTDPGVGLVVLAADCVPVAIVVPARPRARRDSVTAGVAPAAGVAAVHAGRRGLTAGVVAAAVDALAGATGCPAVSMVAVLGPAIGGCCYEVPADMAAEVSAAVPAAASRTTWGTPSLDLRAGVAAQLRAAGLRQLQRIGGCTRCHPVWFSHRASQREARPEGRHALVVTGGGAR